MNGSETQCRPEPHTPLGVKKFMEWRRSKEDRRNLESWKKKVMRYNCITVPTYNCTYVQLFLRTTVPAVHELWRRRRCATRLRG